MRKTTSLCLALAMIGLVGGLAAGCVPSSQKGGTPAALVKVPASNVAVSELVLPAAGASPAVTESHFVMNWMVLGPFLFKETDFGGDQQQAAADKAFMPNEAGLDGTQPAPQGAAWKGMAFTGGDVMGRIDLDVMYAAVDHATAYAVAWLDCPQAVADAKLYAGSDDYLKVWINGKLVHTYAKERRSGERDQDVAKGVALQKGLNRVVVKCVDVVFAWDFYFRLTDAQDRPILVRPKR